MSNDIIAIVVTAIAAMFLLIGALLALATFVDMTIDFYHYKDRVTNGDPNALPDYVNEWSNDVKDIAIDEITDIVIDETIPD